MANIADGKTAVTPDLLRNRTCLRVKEFAALTGLPLPTVYSLITLGKLRANRVGRSILIPRTEIEKLAA